MIKKYLNRVWVKPTVGLYIDILGPISLFHDNGTVGFL
jgi:hypothetical protein